MLELGARPDKREIIPAVSYAILRRKQVEVNTDPQRRCYNGCHASSEMQWTEWEELDLPTSLEKAYVRLEFWTDLNDYAVSQRGQSAKYEFKIEEVKPRK